MDIATSKKRMLMHLDEYSSDGELIGEGDNADYLLKHNQFADEAQKELAELEPIIKVMHIVRNPVPNQMGILQGFDLVTLKPNQVYDYIQVGTGSYHFQLEGNRTATIYENVAGVWTVKETITNTLSGQFTTYKNNIALTSPTNEVKISFTGQYYAALRNIAMYDAAFPTVAEIPDYLPYVSYSVPSNFRCLSDTGVIERSDPRVYQQSSAYKIEGKDVNTKIVLNYYNTGSYDVYYEAYPADITDATPDTYVYEVSEKAAKYIPMYVAAYIAQKKKPDIFEVMNSKYENGRQNLSGGRSIDPQEVQSHFSINYT